VVLEWVAQMFNVGDIVWVRIDGSIKGKVVEVIPGPPTCYRVQFSPIFSGFRETVATAERLSRADA